MNSEILNLSSEYSPADLQPKRKTTPGTFRGFSNTAHFTLPRISNRFFKGVLQLALFALIGSSLSSCGYNTMVTKRETVEQAASQVQNAYQRRADLIPNLVATVKGSADFEKGTLEAVINARASATKVTLNANDLTPEKLQQFQQAQDQVSSTLARLLVVSENYPDLKASAQFQQLAVSLEGTENRISVERMKFNQAVQDYNTTIQTFPNNLMAGTFGFSKKPYFEARAGSDVAPTVKF
jgi:LemA protein